MIDYGAAIDSVKKSSKSELSSRFFSRLKFWTANFRTDGRGDFVGGAATSGVGVGGAAVGLAFDRGWGPAADRSAGPSLDQMIRRNSDGWKKI